MHNRPSFGVVARVGVTLGLACALGHGSAAGAADTPAAVRELDAPDIIDQPAIQTLIAELDDAQESNTRVVVHVTGTDVAQGLTGELLGDLARAANDADLAVLVTPPGTEAAGGASLLYAVASTRLATEGARLSPLIDDGQRQFVADIEGCGDTCAEIAFAAGQIEPPDARRVVTTEEVLASVGATGATPVLEGRLAPESRVETWLEAAGQEPSPPPATAPTATPTVEEPAGGGGISKWALVVLALVLVGAAAVLLRQRAIRLGGIMNHNEHRPPDRDDGTRAQRLGLPQPVQQPRKAAPRKAAPVRSEQKVVKTPKAAGGPGTAVLRTVLQPEGYAEIDGILRRVQWTGSGIKPAPGTLVEVRTEGGRLLV